VPPRLQADAPPSTAASPAASHLVRQVLRPPVSPLVAAEPILAIGDSVLLAASPALAATFGSQITVDAAVGRQTGTGLARLAAYRASGALARYHTVLIDLGTNGVFNQAQFGQLAALTAGMHLVVVFTVHAQRSWIVGDNTTIAEGVAANASRMRLANWNHTAAGPHLLYPDGIHPDPAGAAAYAQLLLDTLKEVPPSR
jgi:lysophospholipase L1-like esterase